MHYMVVVMVVVVVVVVVTREVLYFSLSLYLYTNVFVAIVWLFDSSASLPCRFLSRSELCFV